MPIGSLRCRPISTVGLLCLLTALCVSCDPSMQRIGTPPAGNEGAAPAGQFKLWTGPSTITPDTPGVVHDDTLPGYGVVSGYQFNQRTHVEGNILFENDRWAFADDWHVIVGGTATPGPIFFHVEIDGLDGTQLSDDTGITNSSRDNGGVQGVTRSPFTIDHSEISNVVNGMRLDSGARVTNVLIHNLRVYGGSHTDGIEIYCGTDILVDHSTIDVSTPGSNGATEVQGDGSSGGFCPVSYVTFSNDLLAGGSATFRIADDKMVTHVIVQNIRIQAGSYTWFAVHDELPSNIDRWSNVALTDGTELPHPWGDDWAFGCHAQNTSCPY